MNAFGAEENEVIFIKLGLLFAFFYTHSLFSMVSVKDKANILITENWNITKITVDINEDELKNQIIEFGGMDFFDALNLAFKSFLNDAAHIESPLQISYEVVCQLLKFKVIIQSEVQCFDTFRQDWLDNIKMLGKNHLQKLLNSSQSIISLVASDEIAEYGEKISDYWIFKLAIPQLSDHLFWAIIDRRGKLDPYNYGFN